MDWMRVGGVAVLLAFAGCATGGGAKVQPPTETIETTRDKGTVKVTETTTVQAKVVAIDQKSRMVTLVGARGEETTFRVDDAVKNLAQVRTGDIVTAAYQRAIAFRLRKPGEKDAGPKEGLILETAQPGQRPGAAAAEAVQVTATVTKVDRAKQDVTLRGPKGKSVTVAVEDPTVLDKVKVGDRVEVTYTEAVAISVDKP